MLSYPEGTRFHRLSGYFEMDFAGATPGNVAVTTSGVGFRLRLAFAEVQYGQTFFLAAGQAFSLMTAPKDQLSIWPADVELSQAVDLNYVAGMVWTRSPQLRLTWRPSTRFNWAVSVENPEQQLGKGLVTLPAVLRRRHRCPIQHRRGRTEGAQSHAGLLDPRHLFACDPRSMSTPAVCFACSATRWRPTTTTSRPPAAA